MPGRLILPWFYFSERFALFPTETGFEACQVSGLKYGPGIRQEEKPEEFAATNRLLLLPLSFCFA